MKSSAQQKVPAERERERKRKRERESCSKSVWRKEGRAHHLKAPTAHLATTHICITVAYGLT